MKIDLDKVLKNLDDEPMSFGDGNAKVGKIAYFSLMNSSSEGYLDKIDVAKKIKGKEEETIDLKSEEITIIKKAAKEIKLFTTAFLYAFIEALEGQEEEDE